ncbi:MAG: hypothetical protein QXJ68_00130 [Methanocellales archaeon]
MKIVLLNGKIDREKAKTLQNRLNGVCGFREIVLGYNSTEIIFLEKSIKKAMQIIEEECGMVIERICEVPMSKRYITGKF